MDENELTPAEETQPEPESKADLIHYAISRGEEPGVAVNMTLDELKAKYSPFGTEVESRPLSASEVMQQIQVRTWVCPICGLTACHHNLPYVLKEQ